MFCFLCNSEIKIFDKTCCIFEERTCNENGFVKQSIFSAFQSLSYNLKEINVHSKIICHDCVEMINLYEIIQKQFINIKCKIIFEYNKTAKFYGKDLIVPVEKELTEQIKILQHEKNHSNNIIILEPERSTNHVECFEHISVDDKTSDIIETVSDDLQFDQIIEFDDSENTNENSQDQETFLIPIYDNRGEMNLKFEIFEEQTDSQSENENNCAEVLVDTENKLIDNNINVEYNCNKCSESFQVYENLENHQKLHIIKPFNCNICNKTFAHRSNLSTHIRTIHLKDYSYSCNICGDGFSRKRQLECHIRTSHTGERPFQCNICSSSFAYPHIYARHLKIHAGIKYPCEICGKDFNSRDNRNSHRFIHSDKKRYECSCGVGFMKKFLLQAHMTKMGHTNPSKTDSVIV